jgi:hypothetical protein
LGLGADKVIVTEEQDLLDAAINKAHVDNQGVTWYLTAHPQTSVLAM